jgi:phospholipase C
MKPDIRHLIVLMLENRSFDHLLGYLEYPAEKGFKGIKGREREFGNLIGTDPIYPDKHAEYLIEPGPEHSHASVMTQLFGMDWQSRKTNKATNTGFAADYQHLEGAIPEKALQCFTPDQVPVLSTLAQEFAVCDQWFCSVPGATWPNRNFAHAATSDGLVDIVERAYSNATIYERLTETGKDWDIYFGGFPPQSLAFASLWKKKIVARHPSWLQRIKPIENLYRAIQTDHLPHFAFVEPDMLGHISNSQHPGMGGERDFRAGELLIWTIYEALRSHPEVFEKTLFLITYDEHGGFFDHETPPHGREWMVRPAAHGQFWLYQDADKNYQFDFDVLGPRVPAVLVSPWIAQGTVDHTTYDHASIPATVRDLFGPFPPLTTRDAAASSFAHERNLSLTEPRRDDLPIITMPKVGARETSKLNRVELRESLMELLKLTWQIIREQPGDFLHRVLGPLSPFEDTSSLDSTEIAEKVEERVFTDIVPELSPEAQELLSGVDLAPGLESYDSAGLESATSSSQSPIAQVVKFFEAFLDKLENDERVDDLQKFVETALYKYYLDPGIILRTEEDQVILRPDAQQIQIAVHNLYDRGAAGSKIWLVDEKDRWLTLHANKRFVFDDLDSSFEVRETDEALALRIFERILNRDVDGVRNWFKLGGPVEGPAVGLESNLVVAGNRPLHTDESPIIGDLPAHEIAERLEAMGDPEAAAELRGGSDESGFEVFGLGTPKPWQHQSQQIGFLPLLKNRSARMLDIQSVGDVKWQPSLKNAKINIKLDRINIFSYPGRGSHEIMVVFKAQNQFSTDTESVSFSHVYEVQDGGAASMVGYPVFLGLHTGVHGVAFEMYTINVKNKDDQELLHILESDAFRGGLDLLAGFQPVVKPFTEIVLGLAGSFLRRNENVKVQRHYLGLDFSDAPLGARLAEGNYVVVQVPADTVLRWEDWVFDRSRGTILRKDAPDASLPYNYLVFRVERCPDQ